MTSPTGNDLLYQKCVITNMDANGKRGLLKLRDLIRRQGQDSEVSIFLVCITKV